MRLYHGHYTWNGFAVQRKARPDGVTLIDMLYQLIARTTSAFSTDNIALAVLFIVFLLLGKRYLLHKPKGSGFGEYILCAGLSIIMLLNRGIASEGTIRLLYENNFQIIKSLLYLMGMYLIYLVFIRGLLDILDRKRLLPASGMLNQFVEKLTFWRSALLLFIIWLPQIIIRYPGVLMWDTFWQIKQFLNEAARTSNHPPFGTLLYGIVVNLGTMLGNVNITYAIFTLLQVIAFILVLAYSLEVMKRYRVKNWIRLFALVLYAVSPCYAGWATTICKDTTYLILCMMIGTLLLEFAHDIGSFLADWKRTIGLSLCFILLWLSRYNGIVIVTVFYALALLVIIWRKNNEIAKKLRLRLAAFALATIMVSIGSNEALLYSLKVTKIFMPDVLSIPLQQTGLVVARHGNEVTQEEKETIDSLIDYSQLAELSGTWRADPIKGTYKYATATNQDIRAYLGVWLNQLIRYPLDYLDGMIMTTGMYLDLQSNTPMYISLANNKLYNYVYPYAYNDLSLYNEEELVPLDSMQRMLNQWYFSFDDLPLIGLFASMGFCANAMLILMYLSYINNRMKALWAFIPAFCTILGCLFTPLAYLRYALPYVCAIPLLLAAYDAARLCEHETLVATPCMEKSIK